MDNRVRVRSKWTDFDHSVILVLSTNESQMQIIQEFCQQHAAEFVAKNNDLNSLVMITLNPQQHVLFKLSFDLDVESMIVLSI